MMMMMMMTGLVPQSILKTKYKYQLGVEETLDVRINSRKSEYKKGQYLIINNEKFVCRRPGIPLKSR